MRTAWFSTRPLSAVPTGIVVALGSAAMVATALLCAGITSPSASGVRLIMLAAAAGGFAAYSADAVAAAATAGIAWLVLNGFLVNAEGDLSWHGPVDVWRFVALSGAATAGWLLTFLMRRWRRWRRVRRLRIWLDREPSAVFGFDDKEASPRG